MELKEKDRIFLCMLTTEGILLKLDCVDNQVQVRRILSWVTRILKGKDPKELYRELEGIPSIYEELYCDIYEEVYSE